MWHLIAQLFAAFVILIGLLATFSPIIYGAYRAGKESGHVCTTGCNHSPYGRL